MKKFTRTAAALAAGALLVVPGVALAAPASADDDVERHGRCGGGVYEFTVDREDDGRFEVSVDVDGVKPGSRWTVTLHHDGKRVAQRTLRADREGELDLERTLRNTAGKDRFTFKAKRVDTQASCTRTITVR